MIKNFLKIAFRNIRKYKSFTLINVTGLAVGIASFLLIISYVKYEFEYDSFHKDADKIYRVITDVSMRDGMEMNTSLTSPLMHKYLKENFPQVENSTRLFPAGNMLVVYENHKFYEDGFWFVDSTFFEVFDFEILLGAKESLFHSNNSIVITKSVSAKYFGNEDPLGKILYIDNQQEYTVTGVVQNLPPNSHFRFEFIAFNSSLRSFSLQNWGALSLYTYVKLSNIIPEEVIKHQFSRFVEDHMDERLGRLFKFNMEPLRSIHLYSSREHDFSFRTDVNQIYILSIVALLMVLVASINFMNLSTARSSLRSLEIGIRKVLGSGRKGLVFQHLGESLLLTFLSVIISLILFYIFLPSLNELGDVQIIADPVLLSIASLAIIVFVGLIAGSYPAFFLSSFSPVGVLKGGFTKSGSGGVVRKVLVIFQFAVTTGLLICTGVVYQQMSFIQDKNLGFNKEEILVVSMRDDESAGRAQVLKNTFLQNSGVKSLSITSALPGYGTRQTAYSIPDSAGQGFILHTMYVDENFIPTLDLSLLKGRNFSQERSTDLEESLIINEAAVKRFGWEKPLDKKLQWTVDAAMNDTTEVLGSVVGVIKDFHFKSMFEKIEPLILRYDDNYQQHLALKVNTANIKETVSWVEDEWNNICPQTPFVSFFLNERFDEMYRSEERLGSLFVIFTLIAIIISCLGLFGLSAFTIEQKIKEIGIRKVLGASVFSIVLRFSKEFSLWVIIANVISWPAAFYITNSWIQKFAYRIDLTLLPFILSGFTALLIANTVLSFQTLKAALANPVESLKDE